MAVGISVVVVYLTRFLVRHSWEQRLARRYDWLEVPSLEEWRKAWRIFEEMERRQMKELFAYDMYECFDKLIEEGLVEGRGSPFVGRDGVTLNLCEYRLTPAGLDRYNQEQRRARESPPPDDGNPV